MNKIINSKDAVALMKDGDTIMVGGFYGIGTAHGILDEIIRQEKKDLTMITCEGGWPDHGSGKLLGAGCLKKIIVSWVGNLTNLTELVNTGEVELELNPQGSLIERIRAGGVGLGGVLTKVGLGTDLESTGIGEKVHLNGEDWLYHTPLRADFGIVAANRADKFGNLVFHGTENNYNQCICMACDTVIAEIGEPLYEKGSLPASRIDVSGIFVNYLTEGKK